MRYILLTTFFLTFIFQSASLETYNLIKLADPTALCLDGSPGAYYISKGDPNKVILYFEGGGWCGAGDLASTLQNCYGRSKGALGSSKSYGQTLQFSTGLLSNEQGNYFKDWTKVYLKYCDGSGHQGSRSQSVSYKGQKLYFRGQNITIGQLQSLESSIKLFSSVQKIIVSGGSAGGLATFLWTNYVLQNAKKAKVWSVPDSGIFLDAANVKTDTHTYRTEFENLFKLSNGQTNPPTPQCVQKFKTEKFKCMFAENLHEFIKTPLFPIQSQYDSWSLPNIIGISCNVNTDLSKCSTEQMEQIQQYHRATRSVLLNIGNKPQNGFWSPACVDHVYSQGSKYTSSMYRVPMNSEYSQNNCLKLWINGEVDPYSYHHMDTADWPGNKPCSGTKELTTEKE